MQILVNKENILLNLNNSFTFCFSFSLLVVIKLKKNLNMSTESRREKWVREKIVAVRAGSKDGERAGVGVE